MEVREASAAYAVTATPQVAKGYKQTEVGVIPEEWEVARLGDLFEITSSKRVFQSEWKTEGVPFYRAREIAVLGETGFIDNDLFISKQMYDSFRRVYGAPQVGDLLVTGVGTLGKVYVVPDDREFYFKDGNIIWFKMAGAIDPAFLRQLYLTPVVIKQITDYSAGTTVGTYTISGAKKTVIPLPTKAEQEAIAEALSDADALIESLAQLLAKKRHLKQGAMQELLTGKKRLPGFSGEWEVKRIGDLLTVAHGKSQHGIEDRNGIYPILATGGQIGTTNRFLFDKPSVLIGRKGTIDRPQYMDRPFWTVDTLFYSVIHEPNSAKFLFYRFCLIDWKQHNEASGVPSLNARTIERIEMKTPPPAEQTAIAALLTDMDADLAALEEKLAKAHAIKQGMMQELLTGRIRLV